jgi:hypothetical protein
MDRKELLEFFNLRPRNCLLVTSDRKARPNVAVYGSPRMIDENTIVLASRECRSYRNLRENPEAAIMIAEPGEIRHDSKGVRVYLQLAAIETDGELLESFRKDVAARAGEEASKSLRAAIRFRITEIRGMIDRPQHA